MNIRSDYVLSTGNIVQILQLIANNCKHSKSIEYDFGSVGDNVLTEFGQKCGQKLEEINSMIRVMSKTVLMRFGTDGSRGLKSHFKMFINSLISSRI